MLRAALPVLLVSVAALGSTACAPTPEAHAPAAVPAAEPTPPPATEPAPAEQPEAPPNNKIKWGTASEVDNFGYDVYRGDSEEGPFERITETPIAGAGTTDSPSTYEFVDENIDPTKAYWYYVESISMNNERERFTPIYRAKPKVGEEEPAADTTDS